ncbi:MAG: hypothetical protein ACXQS4_02100 [Methermicoccaceae archaeon]
MENREYKIIETMARRLSCPRCGYEWWYKGNAPYRTTCPRCSSTVVFNRPPRKGDGHDE